MAARDDASELLSAFADYSPPPADARVPKIGVVQVVLGGACKILFDGESVTGGKLYPCVSSYLPVVGDRIVILPVGSSTSWLVIGAIGSGGGSGTGVVLQSPNGTYWRLGVTDSGAPTFTVV